MDSGLVDVAKLGRSAAPLRHGVSSSGDSWAKERRSNDYCMEYKLAAYNAVVGSKSCTQQAKVPACGSADRGTNLEHEQDQVPGAKMDRHAIQLH